MLRIENGRSSLYQWDVDQRLEVDNYAVIEVHFDNAVTSPALVCEVYEEDGHRYANIPNILLQQPWAIRAFGCCGSRVRDVLNCRVIRRERPEDYVYTETEVRRYADLERRISALEEGGTGGAGGAGGDGIFYFDAVLSEDLATLTTETTLDVITAEIGEGKLPICRAEFMGGKLHMPLVTYMEGMLAMFGVSLADTALSASIPADGDVSVSVMRIAHADNMDEMLRASGAITQETLNDQLKEYAKTEDTNAAISQLSEEIVNAVPSTDQPHMQLVTDSDGKAKWENRTHYESYTEIIAETSVRTEADEQLNGLCAAIIPVFDIANGSVVKVVFNGVEYECIAYQTGIGNMSIVSSSVADTGEPFFIVPIAGLIVTTVEMDVAVSVYTREIMQLDNKFLQDDVPRYGVYGELTRVEWDGNTDGLDSFKCDIFMYYKVADIVVPFDHIKKAESKRSDEAEAVVEVKQGTNCCVLRNAIVVLAAGECADERGYKFTANSPGIYFMKHDYTTGTAWCEYAEIDTRREDGILYLTNPSGVKYAITVDDDGTLTASRVT